MKRIIAAFLAVILAVPALAAGVEGTQVMYVGGTIPALKEGTLGSLDTQRPDALVFESPDGKFAIPYREIRSFEYTQRLARRLGVVTTVAVVLVKRRQRRHVIEIAFRGSDGVPQVAVLEVSKKKAQPVVVILEARAPQPCPRGNTSGWLPDSAQPCRLPHTSYSN